MSSTGYINPASGTGVNYDVNLSIQEQDFVGAPKLGAITDIPNSVAGGALRQKTLTFNLNVNTQVAIAHGCVNAAGQPTVPNLVVPSYASGDGYFISQAADLTNIYLTAPAGATTAVTGAVVVVY